MSFDLETWALVNAIKEGPEDNARKLALIPGDVPPELAEALAGAIASHQGPAAARRFRTALDWWRAGLADGDWEEGIV